MDEVRSELRGDRSDDESSASMSSLDRFAQFNTTWDRRIRAAASPDNAAQLAWDRLCGYVDLVDELVGPTVAQQAWQHLDRSVHALQALLADLVRDAIAARHAPWPGTEDSAWHKSRFAKDATRRANRESFWAERYAEHGGTPEKDAKLTWSRLKADVRKLEREEIDDVFAWQRVQTGVAVMSAEMAAIMAPSIAGPDPADASSTARRRRMTWRSPSVWVALVKGWLTRRHRQS